MSLHYILDGYNIMRHPAYRPRGRAHDPKYGLIAYVRDEGLCGSAKNTASFVFDGWPSGFEYDDRRFRAFFSGDLKADDRIKRLVESADVKNTIVVSDDREIFEFAKMHGARAVRVEDFLCPRRAAGPVSDDTGKPELSYDKMRRINDELRDKWLK
jgi:hypothetical protein